MRTLPLIAAVLCSTALLLAQTNKGGISGTVFDQTGAVMPNVAVTITNSGTNQATKLKTSESGTFSAPLLDPVFYDITVEAQGFKKAVVNKVKVDTASTSSVNVTLEPGAVASEITVSAQAATMNTDNGTLGQTITERQTLRCR